VGRGGCDTRHREDQDHGRGRGIQPGSHRLPSKIASFGDTPDRRVETGPAPGARLI
jgi:hypothetical protein